MSVCQKLRQAREAFEATSECEAFARHQQLLAGTNRETLEIGQSAKCIYQARAKGDVSHQAFNGVQPLVDARCVKQRLAKDTAEQTCTHRRGGAIEHVQQRWRARAGGRFQKVEVAAAAAEA